MDITREAFFLDSPRGRRFCVVHRPQTAPKGAVLYVQPFAEEMNKARRMAALAAQAFARRGWLVLQLDLIGCGDSDGDFADAAWGDWLDDLSLAWDWLEAQCPATCVLWTLRSGSLLAADWMQRSSKVPPLLLWQPVLNGRQHLTQFLRLKAVNEMLADTDARAVMSGVRDALDGGRAVEVAGYTLSPELARGIEAAVFSLPAAFDRSVAVLEVRAGERVETSPALAVLSKKLADSGVSVSMHVVQGAAFWQTQEIEVVPELIERSLEMLEWLEP